RTGKWGAPMPSVLTSFRCGGTVRQFDADDADQDKGDEEQLDRRERFSEHKHVHDHDCRSPRTGEYRVNGAGRNLFTSPDDEVEAEDDGDRRPGPFKDTVRVGQPDHPEHLDDGGEEYIQPCHRPSPLSILISLPL